MIDLVPYSGWVPALLGLRPEHTIAELLDTSEGTLDRHQAE